MHGQDPRPASEPTSSAPQEAISPRRENEPDLLDRILAETEAAQSVVVGPLREPIGFRPGEISALFNDRVVGRHADEASFLWLLRDGAVRAPHYTLRDLARLDERVEAHLDGLR